MLGKLRAKFIALNMAIVALVLVVAFGTISYLSYSRDLNDVNDALSATLARMANSPVLAYDSIDFLGAGGSGGASSFGSAGEEPLPGQLPAPDGPEGGVLESDEHGLLPPQIGGNPAGEELMPIVSFLVDAQGLIISLPEFSTALIPDEYLDQAVSEALSAQEDFGAIEGLGLRYGRMVGPGFAYLAFADAAEVAGWRSLIPTLAVVGAVTLAVFFVISLFFSRWALKPVEEAWEQQQRFVADASHELKTPLTVILANAAILRAHPDERIGGHIQWIESTQTEAKRMQGLVNDMLDLARLDADKQAGESWAALDFSDIAEGEALQFESVAFERGVTLECQVEPGVMVAGNATRLQRMARTLIDNACKYADAGGTVSVSLARAPRTARLTVSNTGTAIDAADLPHVFDRFYRADKSRARETGGFGLGLAIAREIAREHKGDITVESSAEAGTSFTVTLPLAK